MKEEKADDRGDREVLSHSLRQAFAGLEILDEDLEIGAGRSAEWVGVDGGGRLILMLWLRDESDAEMLRVLDAIAFLRRNAPLLASHYGTSHVSRSDDHQVAVITLAPTPRMLDRLQGFRSDGVTVLELRRLKARSGEQTYLVPVDVASHRLEPVPVRGLEDFLHALPVDARGLADNLARRIQRMDDDIDCLATETGLTWRLGPDALCGLGLEETGLQGSVPGTSSAWSIATGQDAEAFLEGVLTLYVSLIETDSPPPRTLTGPEPGGGGSEGPELLLTPEELAAFEQFG